ncbi:MAG: ABC transporter permease [Pauljensenia sp.]
MPPACSASRSASSTERLWSISRNGDSFESEFARWAPSTAAPVRARELVHALDMGEWARVRAEKVPGGMVRLTAFAMSAVADGAPTICLVMLGLVLNPRQWVGQERREGSLDWMRTLPVTRAAFLISDLAVWALIALPGMLVGILIGAARFGVALTPAWWLLPGALLVSLTSASIGYAVANILAPSLAQLVSQVFVFVVMLFSPISYPAERLAPWAQELHHWLPFEPMAQVVRSGLASADFGVPLRSWLVLIAWCVVSVVGAAWALGRRG